MSRTLVTELAEEMLDKQHQRADFPVPAGTATMASHRKDWKKISADSYPSVPSMAHLVEELNRRVERNLKPFTKKQVRSSGPPGIKSSFWPHGEVTSRGTFQKVGRVVFGLTHDI